MRLFESSPATFVYKIQAPANAIKSSDVIIWTSSYLLVEVAVTEKGQQELCTCTRVRMTHGSRMVGKSSRKSDFLYDFIGQILTIARQKP
jgi:hypothetical protein